MEPKKQTTKNKFIFKKHEILQYVMQSNTQ